VGMSITTIDFSFVNFAFFASLVYSCEVDILLLICYEVRLIPILRDLLFGELSSLHDVEIVCVISVASLCR
jgi:hypothetical protein